MKKICKIAALLLAVVFVLSLLSVSALAQTDSIGDGAVETEAQSEATPSKLGNTPGDIEMSKRVEFALQGTVTGMLMIFAVLALLAIVVSLSKAILYDLPRKMRENAKAEQEAEEKANAALEPAPIAETPVPVATASDDQLIAVISAAVAAMLEGDEYKGQFESGFRVVSFRRADNGTAWNKR